MKDMIINAANWLWSWPFAIMIVVIGLFITIKTGGIQFRGLSYMFRVIYYDLFKKKSAKGSGSLSAFEALSVSLSGTIGTGNIAGVATAIALGGYGAVFWLWVLGLFSMVTKYSEVILGIKYREYNESIDMYQSGPMYYMKNGMKGNWKWLAMIYASLCGLLYVCYVFVQSNSFTGSLQTTFGLPQFYGGILLAVLCFFIVFGGMKSIAKVATKIVPIMTILYFVCTIYVLVTNFTSIPGAFGKIFAGAFTGSAAVGGFVGATVQQGIRMGFARGVFTTDAGLGVGAIYHGTAKSDNPVKSAMWGLFEVFLDTIIVCSCTSFVIILAGNLGSGLNGFDLTAAAFELHMPGFGQIMATMCLMLFSFTSVYGCFAALEGCWQYVLGKHWTKTVAQVVRIAMLCAIVYGAVGGFSFVWSLTDTMAAALMLCHLPVLAYFAPEVGRITKEYFSNKENLKL